MRKIALLLAVALLVLASDVSFGQGKKDGSGISTDGVIDNWNKPKNFSIGKINSYWIWYDEGTWFFRTTGGGKGTHRFNGKIEVENGKIASLRGVDGETSGPNTDHYGFNNNKTAILFDFVTDQIVDGLNFTLTPKSTVLKFTLAFDGQAAPKSIRIGRDGDNPKNAEFTLPAFPRDVPNKGKKK